MDQAILSALSEAAAPLDKVELVPLVSAKISRTVSAKEVNKALYALAGRGAVATGAEKHGEKPTWVACEQVSAAPAAAAAAAASAAAPASSDDEENRPLQPKAKRAKPKHEPEAAASGEGKDATEPSPAAQSRTVKEEPVDVAIAEEAAASTGSAAAAVKAESSEDEEEVPLSSRVKPAAKKSSSGGRPKGGRRGAAAADEEKEEEEEEEEEEDDRISPRSVIDAVNGGERIMNFDIVKDVEEIDVESLADIAGVGAVSCTNPTTTTAATLSSTNVWGKGSKGRILLQKSLSNDNSTTGGPIKNSLSHDLVPMVVATNSTQHNDDEDNDEENDAVAAALEVFKSILNGNNDWNQVLLGSPKKQTKSIHSITNKHKTSPILVSANH